MREDDDHIRQFAPVLRRIIIMVAVLTAIPVAMWTITAFVRTYVGPPRAPNYQPTRLTPSITSDEAQAAPVETVSAPTAADPNAPSSSVVVARATTTDVDANSAAGAPTTAQAPVITLASTTPAAATATPTPAPGPATNQKPVNPTVVAAQQPAPTNWPAQTAQTNWPAAQPSTDEALPAGDPIAGNIPLPRKRPHSFVVAQSAIPLPRPRPDAAGPGAVAQSATPLQWIHNILRPSSSETPAPQAAPADTDDSYSQTPH